jgi:hypothetical protein
MEETIVNPIQFIEEAKQFSAGTMNKLKVRSMKIGDTIYFKFHSPETGEIIMTFMTLDEFNRFANVELASMIIPAIWTLKKEKTENAKPTLKYTRFY